MPKKHQSKTRRTNKSRLHLQKLYQTPTVEPMGQAMASTAEPVLVTNSQDLMIARLVKRDIIKTIFVAIVLIILLSAIYAVRNTVGIERAINQLAGYVGF